MIRLKPVWVWKGQPGGKIEEQLNQVLGHVFEGKLYFTKDIVDDSFVPTNQRPKHVPQPAAKRAPKPAPKGKHVQLFKMRRRVGKGFYSTAPPDSE